MSGRPRSDPPHRLRITVPASDTSVLRWLEVQESPSISLRMLVRAAIERDGYTDVLTRPVDQLPRRGRPVAESPNTTAGAAHSDDAVPASGARDDHESDSGVSRSRSRASAKRTGASAQTPEPQKQYSIDEIMSSTRQ